MRVPRPAILLPLALLLIAPLAIGHGEEPDAPMDDHDIDERFTLDDAGDWAEVNLFARVDESLVYRATTDNKPVYFDIHWHADTGGVQTPVANKSTTSVSGTFVVPEDRDYSFYVVATEPGPVNVRFQLKGFFALESVEGFTITDDDASPTVPAIAALLGVFALAIAARRR